MPKQVDHEQRRRHIAEAVLRITSRDGLEAVSLRDVAREAGVSMGSVQHYFKTKDDMLVFALERVVDSARERIRARLEPLLPPTSIRGMFRAIAVAGLPMDAESVEEARVIIAFDSRSHVNPRLAEINQRIYTEALASLTEQFQGIQEMGGIPADRDAALEAGTFLAVADGLRAAVVLGSMSKEDAARIAEYHVDSVFGPPEAE
ncbi:TetR family transcriptional regulator C-terminal domain-containing protein [Allokutzneria sp. A3M-2-11 16]|uniref:TetR/AcrR family transcriptional regulator n=1 Tax=Allokutzneria sp. A3M-2-11 16 TaxID=2962043 RepID=UPI0020B8A003|nr:TetR/AcrR family transcriptional regulator [Allokutzneria sp. A3M-2-11 16]MCP3804444.1 TetR family transcriptional regulator C-terminal domain-containing protein [Allokutzneria sp. A3M-2-11 16]